MKEIAIRPVRREDISGVIELCKLHAAYEQAEYDQTKKEEKLSNFLFSETPALYCLIVEIDHKIVGYSTYMKQFSTWDANHYIYMDCLFLTEECRGYGIGEKLIDRIKKEAVLLGCNLIQWQTPAFNKRAMKFYNRIGAKSKSKERYFLETNQPVSPVTTPVIPV
ncbi:GNAT family N-acetyltransferase [Rapidithrix thailandica]|uniref:GNAT family N-acetyltransferase n=1 Tax=Rapidithrix thailandica TaxID=413964 RepID=A0AAW9RZ72_9BACT